jgi:hypothetical protein
VPGSSKTHSITATTLFFHGAIPNHKINASGELIWFLPADNSDPVADNADADKNTVCALESPELA